MNSKRKNKISECCDILDNLRVPINDEIRQTMQGNIPYYGANGIQGYIDKYIFDEDLILLAEDGGNFEEYHTRPIAYKISGKSWVNNHAHILRAKPEFNQDFIFYSLVHKDITKYLNSGTRSKLNKSELEKIEIDFPATKDEEDKIAKILTTADAVIEKTQAAIAKYKAIKQGMLQDLFTRGIDLNTNKLRPRYEDAPELYKDSKLGWIPREWEVEEIGNYSFVTKLAGFEYTLYFDYSKSGPIIAVRALNIKEGKLNLDNIHTIPQETSNYLTRSQLQKGDLVISYVGTVGEVAVIPESNKFHLAPNVAKISVDKNEVNPFYLNQFLNSHIGQKEIYKLIGATTQSALSMGNLRMVNFLKPEIEEQKEIYNRLQSIDNNIQTEQAYLQKMQNLKKGLMEDLLSGRKQVKINEATTV